MRPALLLLAVVALAGCAPDDRDLSTGRLESEVAALYPAAAGAEVRVACDGPLAAEVGATRDCDVRVDGDGDGGGDGDGVRATVRATVTGESDAGPVFETVPVVPADRVARTVLRALAAEGYVVGEVVCAGELVGVVGESVACRAAPPDGGRRTAVRATVRAVEGLDVDIRYRLAG